MYVNAIHTQRHVRAAGSVLLFSLTTCLFTDVKGKGVKVKVYYIYCTAELVLLTM